MIIETLDLGAKLKYIKGMGKTGIIIVLVLILAGGAYFLVSTGKVSNPLIKKTQAPSLGEQIYTQTQNPLKDKIPQTNPFVKVNPFKGVYKNPFK